MIYSVVALSLSLSFVAVVAALRDRYRTAESRLTSVVADIASLVDGRMSTAVERIEYLSDALAAGSHAVPPPAPEFRGRSPRKDQR